MVFWKRLGTVSRQKQHTEAKGREDSSDATQHEEDAMAKQDIEGEQLKSLNELEKAIVRMELELQMEKRSWLQLQQQQENMEELKEESNKIKQVEIHRGGAPTNTACQT